jgi:hypothetical protein
MGKKMFSIQREETMRQALVNIAQMAISAAFKNAERGELQNYLDQEEIEEEIKATGSGRPDTMSRVINPPDNGL